MVTLAITPGEVCDCAAEGAGGERQIQEEIDPECEADQPANSCADCSFGEQPAKWNAPKKSECSAGTEDQST